MALSAKQVSNSDADCDEAQAETEGDTDLADDRATVWKSVLRADIGINRQQAKQTEYEPPHRDVGHDPGQGQATRR